MKEDFCSTYPHGASIVPSSIPKAIGYPGGVSVGISGGVAGPLAQTAPVAPQPPSGPGMSAPIRVGGNVQELKLIREVDPVYPELAKRARVSGTVILTLAVDEESNVAEAKVVRGYPLPGEAAGLPSRPRLAFASATARTQFTPQYRAVLSNAFQSEPGDN